MRIAEIEILELQNIPITPPLFKEPVRATVRLLEIKTDNGITGISQIGGFMHSATCFHPQRACAFLKGKGPSGDRAADAPDDVEVQHSSAWRSLELCGERDRCSAVGH